MSSYIYIGQNDYRQKRDYLTQKTLFSPDKMQKQGIKVSSAWQINIPTSPEELRTDPDLHLFHTRMSVALTPGAQAAIQAVFGKRKACLDEK